jgi:hypothetical protein
MDRKQLASPAVAKERWENSALGKMERADDEK